MVGRREWPLGHGRQLRPHQVTQVWIADVETRSAHLAYTTDSTLLEAPNWAPDGEALLLNGAGMMWRLTVGSHVTLTRVPFDGIPPVNNDHLIDGARGVMYLSANDGHLYSAPLGGGTAVRITHNPGRYHFLHGISPDGTTLAFVEIPAGDFAAPGRLALIASTGGRPRYPVAGARHFDGPEYSPDGAWLYLNTDEFTGVGHAQLARVPAEGGILERLVESPTVDWFPHLSPDGEYASYLCFPAGTRGHPADLDVEVRLVRTSDWTSVLGRFRLFGGQGTINVNSWSPDSGRFAFVAYPIEERRFRE
jgi:TolB protein